MAQRFTAEESLRLASAKIRDPYRGCISDCMKVTDKDVAYVADLANLELTEEERVRMLRDLNSIFEYVERLSELETDKVAPMAQVSDRYNVDESRQGSDRFAYAIREDVKDGLRKSLPHDVAVKNAPDTDGTFFEVPKVIER